MKVTVSIPNVSPSIEADLSDVSYLALTNEGRKDAVLTLLRAYAEAYVNEYITHELGDSEADLTSDELDVIVSDLWNYYFCGIGSINDGIRDLAYALNSHDLQELIGEYVGSAVEARMKVYKVKITCTKERVVYVRALNSDDIENAIDNCWDLDSLMEDGDLDVDDVTITDAFDHSADMDIDEI